MQAGQIQNTGRAAIQSHASSINIKMTWFGKAQDALTGISKGSLSPYIATDNNGMRMPPIVLAEAASLALEYFLP